MTYLTIGTAIVLFLIAWGQEARLRVITKNLNALYENQRQMGVAYVALARAMGIPLEMEERGEVPKEKVN